MQLCYWLLEILKELHESVLSPHLVLLCRGGLWVFLWGGTTEFMTIGMDIWYSYRSNIWAIFSRVTPCLFLLQKKKKSINCLVCLWLYIVICKNIHNCILQSLRKIPSKLSFFFCLLLLHYNLISWYSTCIFILTVHSCIYWVAVNNAVILLHTQMWCYSLYTPELP